MSRHGPTCCRLSNSAVATGFGRPTPERGLNEREGIAFAPLAGVAITRVIGHTLYRVARLLARPVRVGGRRYGRAGRHVTGYVEPNAESGLRDQWSSTHKFGQVWATSMLLGKCFLRPDGHIRISCGPCRARIVTAPRCQA